MTVFVLLAGVLFAIAMPILWLTAEIGNRRKAVRITLGVLALTGTVAMGWVFSRLERLNYNIHYSGAAQKLLRAGIGALESGRQDQVLDCFRKLSEKLPVTYEYRGNFDELAQTAARELNHGSQPKPGTSPVPPVK